MRAPEIEGLQLIPLRRFRDERGVVSHMLKRTDLHFREFGEIYFSSVYPGVVKGWHLHRDVTGNLACISGQIRLAVYDDRPGSSTRGRSADVLLGEDNYSLAVVPPEVWYGFQGLSAPCAIVANCSTHPHDPSRSMRSDPSEKRIPYDWTATRDRA